jgi:hypothetical protein
MGVNCMVTLGGVPTCAIFLGLVVLDAGDTVAIVRIPGEGMYLQAVHPSRVALFPAPA